MYVDVGNLPKSEVPCKLSMRKSINVVKYVDVRECTVCALYVMYVSEGNSQESVIPCELPMGKLVGVVKQVDVRACIVCTLYVMYLGVGNSIRTSYDKVGQCGATC